MDLVYSLFIFLIGASVGSFLNVCIHRIPKGWSIVSPPSKCACGKRIRWSDNIPIASWLLLKGKARCCGRFIGIGYLIIEAVTAFLFLYSWFYFGSIGTVIAGMIFSCIVICTIAIDWSTLTIPDFLTIGGTITGVCLSALIPEIHSVNQTAYIHSAYLSVGSALVGAFIGSGLLIWIAILGELLLKKEAMGFGDIKLIGCIGAFCGWEGAVFSVFAGATLGVVILLPILIFHLSKQKWANKKQKLSMMKVPFGPWLAVSALLYFFLLKPHVLDYINTLTIALH